MPKVGKKHFAYTKKGKAAAKAYAAKKLKEAITKRMEENKGVYEFSIGALARGVGRGLAGAGRVASRTARNGFGRSVASTFRRAAADKRQSAGAIGKKKRLGLKIPKDDEEEEMEPATNWKGRLIRSPRVKAPTREAKASSYKKKKKYPQNKISLPPSLGGDIDYDEAIKKWKHITNKPQKPMEAG